MSHNGAGPEQPWERQDGEPDRAWAAFIAYRDLAPGERSLNRSRTGGGPVLSELKRWSGRWGWVKRVRAWDAHVDTLRRAGAEEVQADRGRTGAELAARVRAVLAEILARPDLDSSDVLRAARALRELALAVPEAPAPPALHGASSGMRPAVNDDGRVIVDGHRVHPPPTPDEDRRKAAGVLAVLEEAGVIALPPWSDEPGRVGGGNGHLPPDDDAY